MVESRPTSKVWQPEFLGRPDPSQEPLEARLLAFCDHLTNTQQYNEEEGFYYWPWAQGYEQKCGICTHGARHVAREFKGQVRGYTMNPREQLIGSEAGGHDFAIVGDYLVDWWGMEYDCTLQVPVLHRVRDAKIVRAHYKPTDQWEELEIPKV